jgi:hypothetical protein
MPIRSEGDYRRRLFPSRKPFQFSLRIWLLVILLASIGGGFFAQWYLGYQQRSNADELRVRTDKLLSKIISATEKYNAAWGQYPRDDFPTKDSGTALWYHLCEQRGGKGPFLTPDSDVVSENVNGLDRLKTPDGREIQYKRLGGDMYQFDLLPPSGSH